MSIELVTKYLPYVDEIFTTESRRSLVTSNHFTWENAKTVKVYKVTTSQMNDYGRTGTEKGVWSRYGKIDDLDATTQSLTLRKDRSFTFAIDRLDKDETIDQLAAASALARQLREVAIPEIDRWCYQEMVANAGQGETGEITATNIYDAIVTATNALDDEEVPEDGRFLLITPSAYALMKKSKDIIMETDIAQDMRRRGVIAMLDGMNIIRVPASKLPEKFRFIAGHPITTVSPVKLESYKVHTDPPGISGDLVEGRLNFDTFILDNKAVGLYYHKAAD